MRAKSGYILLLGGNISNPVCNGQTQSSGITDLYSSLANCKTLVSNNCIIDDVLVG